MQNDNANLMSDTSYEIRVSPTKTDNESMIRIHGEQKLLRYSYMKSVGSQWP